MFFLKVAAVAVGVYASFVLREWPFDRLPRG